MRDRVGDEAMHERTGHVPEAFHVGPKLLWIRQHEPEVFAPDPAGPAAAGRGPAAADRAWPPPTRPTRTRRCCSTCAQRRVGRTTAGGRFDVDPAPVPRGAAAVGARRRSCRDRGRRGAGPAGRASRVVIGAADSQCAAFGAGVVAPGPVSEMAGASSCLNSVVLSPLADLRVTHYSHVVPGLLLDRARGQHDRRGDRLGGARARLPRVRRAGRRRGTVPAPAARRVGRGARGGDAGRGGGAAVPALSRRRGAGRPDRPGRFRGPVRPA